MNNYMDIQKRFLLCIAVPLSLILLTAIVQYSDAGTRDIERTIFFRPGIDLLEPENRKNFDPPIPVNRTPYDELHIFNLNLNHGNGTIEYPEGSKEFDKILYARQHQSDADIVDNIQRVAEQICALPRQPDIICLQEVDKSLFSRNIDVRQLILDQLAVRGKKYWAVYGHKWDINLFICRFISGNMILVRESFRLIDIGNHILCKDYGFLWYRKLTGWYSALFLDIETPYGRRFRIINTDRGKHKNRGMSQVANLIELLQASPPESIIAGDWNCRWRWSMHESSKTNKRREDPTFRELASLIDTGVLSSYPDMTEHIFIQETAGLEYVWDEYYSVLQDKVSDHQSVVTKIRLTSDVTAQKLSPFQHVSYY
jgi:endonuclease/exonuclease/phosphatase family metal-dependent hydrolase